jgi:hypothetical protein
MRYFIPFSVALASIAALAACGALREAQDDMQPPVGAPGLTLETGALRLDADATTSDPWAL